MKNYIDFSMKVLKFAVSKDETRPHLCGVYHDADARKAVATNGMVLAAISWIYDDTLQGKIITSEFRTMNRDYVRWQAVVPTKFANEAIVKVEKHHYVKTKQPTKIFLSQDGLSFENKNESDLCINAEFLKPLIGETFKFQWNQSLSVIKVVLNEKNDDFYLIMPLRGLY